MGVDLLLNYPHLVDRTCKRCAEWKWDDNGFIQLDRLGRQLRRPPGAPTPCSNCPKKSPEHSAGMERQMARILRTFQLYWENRAAFGCLTEEEKADPILMSNLGVIARLVQNWERSALVTSMNNSVTQLLTKAFTK